MLVDPGVHFLLDDFWPQVILYNYNCIYSPQTCQPPKKNTDTRWWFQPIWKICSSTCIISPGIGVKIKNHWNHHLGYVFWMIFHSHSPYQRHLPVLAGAPAFGAAPLGPATATPLPTLPMMESGAYLPMTSGGWILKLTMKNPRVFGVLGGRNPGFLLMKFGWQILIHFLYRIFGYMKIHIAFLFTAQLWGIRKPIAKTRVNCFSRYNSANHPQPVSSFAGSF